ncbi:MAG: hypothetical protein QGG54_15290 [Gammaproteobacteria bacterium]|nr:hypothetical protein [Gammaproteobacteria bacterium]
MFFYSRLQASFRSYLSLAALLSTGLTAAQPGLAQQQTPGDDWIAATMCPADNRSVDLEQTLSFTYTEADGNNPRHLDAAQAGLTTADLSKLELAWAVAFPETSGLRAARDHRLHDILFRHRFRSGFCFRYQHRLCQMGL